MSRPARGAAEVRTRQPESEPQRGADGAGDAWGGSEPARGTWLSEQVRLLDAEEGFAD